jgi:MFS family permease
MKTLLKNRLGLTLGVLKSFRGNTRACIALEPMWGIPFNLYVPYASLYMLALGLSATQIGLVTAVGLVFQMFFALSGGHITDKLGRRRTSLVFDIISWTVPTLIWAVAQNFYFFLAAAVLNAMVRIVQNSWNCLMIEDTLPSERVHIYTWIEVANIMAGFFAPLAGFFILKYTLVPATRGFYVFAFVSMTAMFLLRNKYTHETSIGRIKMADTRHHTIFDSLKEYPEVLRLLFKNPLTLAAFAMALLNNIHIVLKNTFFGIILNKGIELPQASLAIFPALNSAVVMFIYIFIMPSLGKRNPKRPLFWGLVSLIVSYGILLIAPPGSFSIVLFSTFVGAVGMALVTPFVNSNLANHVRDEHRAKTMSIVYAVLYGGSAPFGYLAGYLTSFNPRLPAALLLLTFGAGIACLFVMRKHEKKAAPIVRTAEG